MRVAQVAVVAVPSGGCPWRWPSWSWAGCTSRPPSAFRVSTVFQLVFPVVLVVLLATLVVGDPGRIDRAQPWLRVTTGVMIGLISVWSVGAVGRLVVGILQKAVFTTPTELLTVGAVTWITNVIAFALWFWYLDETLVARAADGARGRPGFRFCEQDIPELVDEGWYPQFVDYLALSFNTSTALQSPTSHRSGTGRSCASWRRRQDLPDSRRAGRRAGGERPVTPRRARSRVSRPDPGGEP